MFLNALFCTLLVVFLGNVVAQGPCKSKGCGGGTFVPVPDGFYFGKECKSKGCGILKSPSGDTFIGGGCKSKGCPLPPGTTIPGVSPTPLPPQPDVCCTPEGCRSGYRRQCMAGALTLRLALQGYFVASGSCSGPLKKFRCKSAEGICSGNRGRCVYKRCKRRGKRSPSPSPKPKNPHPYPPYPYWPQTPSRMYINVTEGLARSTGRQESLCKSKGCPFGEPDEIFFGGSCKSKGCGIVNTPSGPIYVGGACKSKGCPVPPGLLTKPSPAPSRRPNPPLPPRVPAFRPPKRGQCCFARKCNTQRLCRCTLA